MRHLCARATSILLLLLPAAALPQSDEEPDTVLTYGCENNPAVIDACFHVHGRVNVVNGTPGVRLWIVGTKRILGVSAEGEGLPQCLSKHLDYDTSIYGDFLVCPFTEDKPGVMRSACIQSVSNMVVERISQKHEIFIPKERSCAQAPALNRQPTAGLE